MKKVTGFEIGKVVDIKEHTAKKEDNLIVTILTDYSMSIADRLLKLSNMNMEDSIYYKEVYELFKGNRLTQSLLVITEIVDNNGVINEKIIQKIKRYKKSISTGNNTTITLVGLNNRLFQLITLASKLIDSDISEQAIINNSLNGVHVLNNRGRVITTTTHELILHIRELVRRKDDSLSAITNCDNGFLFRGRNMISVKDFDLLFDLEVN